MTHHKHSNNSPPNLLQSAKSGNTRGLKDMLVASLLFSIMNASVYAISLLDANLSVMVISFARIFCNLLILVIPAMIARKTIELFGDKRPSLWLRGLFGASALMLSFAAIQRIGPGESAFLTACNGIFVAVLSPLILGQKNSLAGWLAIIGAFTGVSLMFAPDTEHIDFIGRGMALGSGFLSALAYLMVARAGRSNPITTVIFYFCLMALLLHILYFCIYGYQLPDQAQIWGLLLLTGLTGSAAQFFMTRAYQRSPAALVSAVSYLVPVLSLIWSITLFMQIPNQTSLYGAMLILVFGVLLPFLR